MGCVVRRKANVVRVSVVGLLVGCSVPIERTSVRVTIDADDAIRAAAVEVIARVEKSEDNSVWRTVVDRDVPFDDGQAWPISFLLPPSVTDTPGYYQLTATARDDRNAMLGLVRVIRDFRDRSQSGTLRAFFEVECLRLSGSCERAQTCHAGSCVSAESTDEELGAITNAQHREPVTAAPTGMQSTAAATRNRAGDECATADETGCATGELQVPLTCRDGRWQQELPCQRHERCVANMGCRAISPECVDRGDDDVFCDGDTMRDCSDPVVPPERPCGEHAACAVTGGMVSCACKLGFVRDGAECRAASRCDMDHGGCDRLASCREVGNAVQCGACPSGYAGDGRTGCSPLLAALDVSGAQLSPALSPNARQFRARVPLLAVQVQLMAEGPPETTLEIDTHPIAPGSPWNSPILEFGDNTFELAVVSKTGVRNVYQLIIQRDGEQRAYLKAGEPDNNDLLGLGSLSATADTLVAGAPWEDGGGKAIDADEASNGATDSGAAYVFVRERDTWIKQAYFKATDAAASDYFATSTAISGDTIAIGARRADLLGVVQRPGAVYVFERANGKWAQTDRIEPPESAAGDLFGTSVSLDADTLVVGTPSYGGSADSEGAAHVFTHTGGSWVWQQTLRASKPIARSSFGSLVKVRDGVLVVAAEMEESASGAAYVFTRGAEGWVERQRLTAASPREEQRFGWSIDTSGDTIVVGGPYLYDITRTMPAGEAYVFQRAGDMWQRTGILRANVPRPGDYFGEHVALTSRAIVIGASGDDSAGRGVRADPMRTGAKRSGAAYVFSRDPGGWRSPTFIKASNTGTEDGFGFTVAATETEVFVSAPWESSNGDQANDSVTGSGAIYVFR